jgi:hypothetical protein
MGQVTALGRGCHLEEVYSKKLGFQGSLLLSHASYNIPLTT